MDLMKFTPRMSPARNFINPSAFIQVPETAVGIGLQRAFVVFQMPAWMLALAIRRVSEPHSCRYIGSGRAVITHVGPQASGLRLATTRCKHRNRSVVGMDLVRGQNVPAQRVDEWS